MSNKALIYLAGYTAAIITFLMIKFVGGWLGWLLSSAIATLLIWTALSLDDYKE